MSIKLGNPFDAAFRCTLCGTEWCSERNGKPRKEGDICGAKQTLDPMSGHCPGKLKRIKR